MDKITALRELAQSITGDFGGGSLMRLGDDPQIIEDNTKRQSFGLLDLDLKSAGGLCFGKIHEIFGNEGEGKTTLALEIIAQCQRDGLVCHYVDAEHKLNLEYAKTLGVCIEDLMFTQPSHGEHALDITKNTLQSGLIDVCVIDSITSLVPLAEINGEFTDANIGAHARLMSKMCRSLTPIISENNVIFIAINQIRHKIGVMFGSPEVTTGGKALKFYSIMRMRVSSKKFESSDKIERRQVDVSFVKQQSGGRPYDKSELLLELGMGFDKGWDIINTGLQVGVLKLAGSHVKYNDKSIGNGKLAASKSVLLDEDLLIDIVQNIKAGGRDEG